MILESNETPVNCLHLKNGIKRIEQSIDELEKAKAVLLSMLPRKPIDTSKNLIQLPGGKVIDFSGKEVKNGD